MKIPSKFIAVTKEWAYFAKRRFEQSKKGIPILVTGPQRCGTTWFGQMIHGSGMRSYHEPLGQFGALWNHNICDESESGVDTMGLNRKIRRILAGNEWQSYTYQNSDAAKRRTSMLSPVRCFGDRTGRVIVKDPTCVGMLDEIAAIAKFFVVVLVRHPCGYVASLKRLKWEPIKRLQILLTDEIFKSRFLHAGWEMAEVRNLVSQSTFVERAAVQYCLLLHLANSHCEMNPNTSCSFVYDELARDPIRCFQNVFSILDLPYDTESIDRHRALTSGKPGAPGRHDVRRNSIAACSSWINQLTDKEIESIHRLWIRFGPSKYGFEFN